MVVVAEVWNRSGLHHALCTYYDMACHESMDTSYIRRTTFLRCEHDKYVVSCYQSSYVLHSTTSPMFFLLHIPSAPFEKMKCSF